MDSAMPWQLTWFSSRTDEAQPRQSMLLTLFRELPPAPWFDEKERNHA